MNDFLTNFISPLAIGLVCLYAASNTKHKKISKLTLCIWGISIVAALPFILSFTCYLFKAINGQYSDETLSSIYSDIKLILITTTAIVVYLLLVKLIIKHRKNTFFRENTTNR